MLMTDKRAKLTQGEVKNIQQLFLIRHYTGQKTEYLLYIFIQETKYSPIDKRAYIIYINNTSLDKTKLKLIKFFFFNI